MRKVLAHNIQIPLTPPQTLIITTAHILNQYSDYLHRIKWNRFGNDLFYDTFGMCNVHDELAFARVASRMKP